MATPTFANAFTPAPQMPGNQSMLNLLALRKDPVKAKRVQQQLLLELSKQFTPPDMQAIQPPTQAPQNTQNLAQALTPGAATMPSSVWDQAFSQMKGGPSYG